MAFRAPPTQVGRHAANLLKGNLLKSTPAWLPAVTAVPPGPSIIRVRSKDNNTAALSEKEKQLFQNNAQKTAINRHKEKHLRTKPPRPQPIRYPEDKLRREFYRDHPFELARPQNLVENKLALNRTDFSQLLLPGLGPEDITGETVIKYQLYLMTHKGMSKRKAYAQATSEFYEIRARQEENERKVKADLLKSLESSSTAENDPYGLRAKPHTKRALEKEEEYIKAGQEALALGH